MLQFILGVSGTGKTYRVFNEIKARAQQGKRSILLVPEQFSSSTETMAYTVLGDALSAFADVYSFTTLAEAVLKTYGGVAAQTLTDAGRVVMVRRAMDGLGDALTSYRSHRRNTGFCSLCADAIKELKTAGAKPETLLSVAQEMGADGGKLQELSLIYAAYEGLLRGVALDPADRVSVAAERMQPDFLAGKAVFVDNFDGFTAPQYALLGCLVTAEQCTVALCCDTLSENEGGYGLFSPVRHAAQRLRRLAARKNVPVAVPQMLAEDVRHVRTPVLSAVNTLLCGVEIVCADCADGAEGFALTPAGGVYDECKTVAAQIAKLVADGAQYGDMAVICRLMDSYAAALHYELTLAGIPYFTDETTTLEHTAPAAFLRAALGLAANSLTSEGVLRLLKTGLCGFAAEEIAALENYAYTWQLHSEDWRAPFVKNPSGFGPAGSALTAEDAAVLEVAERVRAAAVPKLDAFLRAMHGTGRGARAAQSAATAASAPSAATEPTAGAAANESTAPSEPTAAADQAPQNGRTAGEISHALYALLQAFDGAGHTAQLAETLGFGGEKGGEAVYRTWNTMMAMLDQMNALLGEDFVTAQEYDDLLVLLLRASDIGHVPQTQNVVIVTTADRMRLQNPRYCFVLGVAEGEFPKTVGYSGLLTHTDRERLVQSGVDMPGSYENRMLLEQMFFYKALTAPSQGLYLSAVAPEAGGAPLSSALTGILRTLTPHPLSLSLAEKARAPAAALDLLGAQYREDTPETAALAAALETDAAAADSLRAMERAAVPPPFAARNTAVLKALIGRSMTLSPTRIEQYYRCRFAYFLQYVLRIRPRKKAELSPLETGSLVHYILENALREAGEA
ncbi:MAG: PD-(D/E)XK nuclease family protein, partial [Ruthenibacterium sp.]